jgi:broad specificity phosphatase PhoE
MASDGQLWLVRHGETEWSRDGLHTSRTDLPLTARGEDEARNLASVLRGTTFDLVLSSPRVRAQRTAELAGFRKVHVEHDLVEWDYGEYEGITTPQIRERVPGWTVWSHPVPGGEPPDEVGRRLDRVITKVRANSGRVLVFGHSHALRALTARWLGQSVSEGRLFKLDTGTVSVLGYERETAVVLRWNSPA